MRAPKYTSHIVILLFAVLLFVTSNNRLLHARRNLGAEYRLNIQNIPEKIIPIMAGEFRGLFSDFILLQVASFCGSNRNGKEYSDFEKEKIYLGFKQVMALDPYFEQSYLLAQSELSWVCRRPERGNHILNIANQKRFWDFRPAYYKGFNYYYFMNDFHNAAIAFSESSQKEKAPLLVTLLASRFSARSGQTEAALQLMQQMLQSPDMEEKHKKELQDRISALNGILLIEQAIEAYTKLFGESPQNLNMLLEKKIINKLPENPYGKPYEYDKKNGRIIFDHAEKNDKQ